ncbi:hypothetical protein G7046_g4998 [Stylonectria norvegica]|nr:hypothetical protein G7046_g4998 [Stylonectria norvegica]
MPADAAAASEDLVIIGIDFGTTFSGVAWACSKDPDDIELVTSWDAELNHCSDIEKAPTQLHYDDGGNPASWGYAISPDKLALKWFKLLLLDGRDTSASVSASPQLIEARDYLKEIRKEPIDVVGDFLRYIWEHAMDSIRRTLGSPLLDRCKFHVVITVPAIWPHYAQQRMKQAAKLSGILNRRLAGETTIRFISEPEAAALATLKDLSKKSSLEPGDSLVICDAGGGTVDLISYSVETVEPFVVKECVQGDGDLCGGVFLDEAFLKLIKAKVGVQNWAKVSRAEEKRFMNDSWEHGIKPQFQNQKRNWLVDLPRSCRTQGKKGMFMHAGTAMQLSSPEILSVFSPTIEKINNLVAKQAKAVRAKDSKPAKYVILVGGFGRSRYLFDSLQAEMGPSTAVLQSRGSKPWTAICRGAVVQGLTKHDLSARLGIKVEARISRLSYGIEYQTPWVQGKHLEIDREWDQLEQAWFATDQMEWFLNQGEDINDMEPVRKRYYMNLLQMRSSSSVVIWTTSTFPPPTRSDDTVRELCRMEFRPGVALESLPLYTNDLGTTYRRLDYDITLTCEEGTADFTVYYQNERVGSQNVSVKYY